ncbi:hypothetical protein [Streptomyces sp. MZ04]|uniref:hypothetical protein n=1 Tax=Streptomyces sp. MZ04 TaxID=2559236 RepID=UPI00107EE2AE|nr:hypothetical protein [Streptomyces sp. MZ04]TGB14316.1 hypothetical protein E2651_06450 [Streptomyces sp. MZ04]
MTYRAGPDEADDLVRLGYSGSAAAGAALAGAGSARAADGEPAEAAEAAQADAARSSDANIATGTKFAGDVSIGDIDAMMQMSFSINIENAPAAKQITPMEIVDAFNEIATSRGRPPMTFYYATSAPLN